MPRVAFEALLVGVSVVILASAAAVGVWVGQRWLMNWLIWSAYLVLILAFALGGLRQGLIKRRASQ